jgi:hypothetical protein
MTGNGIGQGLSDMWRSVLLFLPKALVFVVILAVGYVLARLLRTLVAKGLRRAGFDKAVSRGTVGRALRNVSAADLCAKIVFYAVLLFALQLAFGIWGPNPVSDLLTALIAWLPRAFVAIVIVVVAAAIAGAVHDLIVSALGGLPYGKILARVVAIVIVTLGVIAALDQVRIATSVTQPLLIAVLAMVAGVVIVGVGGGLIRPMQHRWEGWLDRASAESELIREHAKAYAEEKRAAEEAERARVAEEAERARVAEEAERARVAEEAERARVAEEARQARAAEEKRVAEEARRAHLAQEERRAEEARVAKEAEDAQRTENARQAALAAAEAERQAAASRAASRAESRAAADAPTQDLPSAAATDARPATGDASATGDLSATDDPSVTDDLSGAAATDDLTVGLPVEELPADETQVIPNPRARRVTDSAFDVERPDHRPDFIPGFEPDGDPDATTVITSDGADTTIINPGPDSTVVIGAEETQVIPTPAEAADDSTTQNINQRKRGK